MIFFKNSLITFTILNIAISFISAKLTPLEELRSME